VTTTADVAAGKGSVFEAAAARGCRSSPGDRVSLGDALPRRRAAEHGLLLVQLDSLVDHSERFVGSLEVQR
jgi:hypothetical protein